MPGKKLGDDIVGKTKAKWLLLDPADPNHVGAETLPFDAASTIKEKVLYIYNGANRISDTEPSDESMLPRETVIWYDTVNHVVRRKHKDSDGAVRYMDSATGVTVLKKSVGYTAVDGEFVVAIQPIYVTLQNSPNARITVKSGVAGQIVVIPASGTIDGQESFSLNSQYEKATFVCDGTDWWVS